MKTHILGLDISTAVIGFAVMTTDFQLIAYDKLKFKKGMSLEERALFFKNKVEHFDSYYCVSEVYVEQPAMMFGRGKTTANTMAKLQRFNGMCCYAVYELLKSNAIMIHTNTARKKMNIKIPRNVLNKKHFVIECVEREYPSFKYNLTRFGNPQPGTDDMADAIVIAHAGVHIYNEGENDNGEGKTN
jgi:Holliday junction resolvasome RuvABC endonuclease subunit